MYDILQLNDMLVPELLDIAEQLKITNAKKLNKQDLIYKILDSQAVTDSKTAATERPKRKRIVKATTSIGTEEAFVEEDGKDQQDAETEKTAKAPAKKKKAPAKKSATKKAGAKTAAKKTATKKAVKKK